MRKGIDHTGVSIVFICHDGNGEYLAVRRSANCRDEHGRWEPGAGGLEVHDSVIDTLYREISEEFCTEPIEYKFLGYRDMHREHAGERTHWIALDFKVRLDRAQVCIGEPHKHDAIGWFTIDAIPEPQHSQFPHFIKKYRDRLA